MLIVEKETKSIFLLSFEVLFTTYFYLLRRRRRCYHHPSRYMCWHITLSPTDKGKKIFNEKRNCECFDWAVLSVQHTLQFVRSEESRAFLIGYFIIFVSSIKLHNSLYVVFVCVRRFILFQLCSWRHLIGTSSTAQRIFNSTNSYRKIAWERNV